MAEFSSLRVRKFYTETYDSIFPDWPGEIEFYRELAAQTYSKDRAVSELACGTGRVAIRIAQESIRVVGLDLSPIMLSVASKKNNTMSNLRWVQRDMRSFELGETFGLVIIPGHPFQNILTPEDQVATLNSIKRHLVLEGTLVVHIDHLDIHWLGQLPWDQQGVFKNAETFTHPHTDQQIRTSQSWSYESVTYTAISQKIWEAVDAKEEVVERWESGPLRFHCVFRFEMQHLLERTDFAIQSMYEDFYRNELTNDSSEMIWVAKTGK
jgi:SAM-dependent methyltransferase